MVEEEDEGREEDDPTSSPSTYCLRGSWHISDNKTKSNNKTTTKNMARGVE